ncbi:MAG: hypothetical protein Q8R00_04965 [Candidatus Nanoarchaeia archaeon]|nr:hypothetical protein [Candidatus Nanoarchaeia archaeon]
MKLIFKIDKEYLINHTLFSLHKKKFSSNKYKKDLLEFQKIAKSYESKNTKKSLKFNKIIFQTKKYLNFCKKQWKKNYAKSYSIIKEITGLNLNKSFTIYITHPSLKNGMYLGSNTIGWGHNEDWKNYTTVYLWHEILHAYMPKDKIAHAIIELTTDEELRIKLNGGRYFSIDCHPELKNIKKKLMPEWKEYLKQKSKNIKSFYNGVKNE